MKRTLLFLLLGVGLIAQNYIKDITDANPFDPNRGQEPVEVEEQAPIPIMDLPILDGTIIFADKKLAMFSFFEGGESKTARVTLNDSFGGYEVTEINAESVILTNGGDNVPVKLYSGAKKNRGGSRVVAAPSRDREPAPSVVSPGGTEVTPVNPPVGNQNKVTSRFKKAVPQVPPSKTLQQAPVSKRENAKGKI